MGLGSLRFYEYIEELTSQVNTSTSNMDEINTQVSSQQQVLGQIQSLLKRQEVVVITIADITVKPYEILICNNTSSITVTTPINPLKGDIVPAIKRKDARVKVLGPIDGKTFKIINVKNYSMKLAYDGIEWSEV